jgi:hypothetical protein
LLLTFRESEEKIVENILSALAERIKVVFTKPIVSETLSFPGVLFCPCERLEILFRAVMGYSLLMPQNAPEMPLKRFLRHSNRPLHFYLSMRVWKFPNK